jgi:DNA-binding response OmpR family regulator
MTLICVTLPRLRLHQFADEAALHGVTLKLIETGLPNAAVSADAGALIVGVNRAADVQQLEALRADGVTRPMIAMIPGNLVGLKVTALEAGADTTIDETASWAELMATVRTLLRRPWGWGEPHVHVIGELTLDTKRHQLYYQGRQILVPPSDFQILADIATSPTLTLRKPKPTSTATGTGSVMALESAIRRLRQRLGDVNGQFIRTIRGVGYRLQSAQIGVAGEDPPPDR